MGAQFLQPVENGAGRDFIAPMLSRNLARRKPCVGGDVRERCGQVRFVFFIHGECQ